jgi:hypothetical protein
MQPFNFLQNMKHEFSIFVKIESFSILRIIAVNFL